MIRLILGKKDQRATKVRAYICLRPLPPGAILARRDSHFSRWYILQEVTSRRRKGLQVAPAGARWSQTEPAGGQMLPDGARWHPASPGGE